MNDIYEGDPKLINGKNGTRLEYKGGQPEMDRGVENSIAIDLGTRKKGKNSHQKGWVGNYLLPTEQRIGSDYLDTVENQPQTLSGLSNIEKAAKKALSADLYGNVEAAASYPKPDTMVNIIRVNPPAGAFTLRTQSGQLWRFQALKESDKPVPMPGFEYEYKTLTNDISEILTNTADDELMGKVRK